jgi:ribosome-binding factor A
LFILGFIKISAFNYLNNEIEIKTGQHNYISSVYVNFVKKIFMSTIRQNKVARLIQKELSDIFLQNSSSMFNNAMISVTVVRMSPDFSVAKIYLSIFNTQCSDQEVFETVQLQKSKIRHLLGQKIRNQVRVIPEMAFFIDDSLDYYNKIDDLLK